MAAPTARATVCIERAGWAIAWDAAAGRHCYRRDVDVVFAGDRIAYVGDATTVPSTAGSTAGGCW